MTDRSPYVDASGPPTTIKRLHALRPGQRFRYYIGSLDSDVANSGPAYRRLIEQIFFAAMELAKAGRIVLTTEKVHTPGTGANFGYYLTAYIATGVR